LSNIGEVLICHLVRPFDIAVRGRERVKCVEILEVCEALDAGKVDVELVNCRKVKIFPKFFFAGKHVVDLRCDGTPLARGLRLIRPLEILNGFIWVFLVEGLDLRELLVECFEGIAGRNCLDLLATLAICVFVDVE
jgi:hypothetical protein